MLDWSYRLWICQRASSDEELPWMSSTCETFSSKPISSVPRSPRPIKAGQRSSTPEAPDWERFRSSPMERFVRKRIVLPGKLTCSSQLKKGRVVKVKPYLLKMKKHLHVFHAKECQVRIIFGCNGRVWIGDANQGDEVEQELSIGTREVICRLASSAHLVRASRGGFRQEPQLRHHHQRNAGLQI
ncbi:uncharacterized protein LOC112345683 [Selaginella moellendorffii]|uniref:uncharacterized protein LOC112345683 n=1 Tax=Selaginella moellendorffii TaxID=88036 RepID=UPI000D1CAAC7|nr:uncharacterized protein LOC112345683 [Selaginella moellendorffii]|eukprot:XP_024528734.1 uncharacterized protein LOC112345683 [Selaginella moellendorffii]